MQNGHRLRNSFYICMTFLLFLGCSGEQKFTGAIENISPDFLVLKNETGILKLSRAHPALQILPSIHVGDELTVWYSINSSTNAGVSEGRGGVLTPPFCPASHCSMIIKKSVLRHTQQPTVLDSPFIVLDDRAFYDAKNMYNGDEKNAYFPH